MTVTALVEPSHYNQQFITILTTTRYTHAHQVPHVEHIESSKWRSSKRWWDDAVLSSTYPFTSQRAK